MKNQSLIMGINCMQEVATHSPEKLIEAYVVKSEQFNEKKHKLLSTLKSNNIPIKYISKNEMTNLVQSDSHQSFAAKIKDRAIYTLKDIISKKYDQKRTLFLMLDSIFDPHNFGAILRTAECFNADGVIWSKNRGSDISAVVAKTSSGASEFVNLIKVSNLFQSVKTLQEEGYTIIASCIGKDSESINSFSFPDKSVIIMGSEGRGIQPILEKNSDNKVYIPMLGKIDSLNVSQATAIFLYNWSKSGPM